MRSFVALCLPDALCAAIEDVQAALPAGRPVPAENLHLTLAFLGDEPEPALVELDLALRAIVLPPVRLDMSGLDVFGGKRARGIWLHAVPTPELVALQRRVAAAVRQAGLEIERRRFRPHVTLARFGARGLGDGAHARLAGFLAESGGVTLPGAQVSAFGLFRSDLHRDGARYTLLADYPLGPG